MRVGDKYRDPRGEIHTVVSILSGEWCGWYAAYLESNGVRSYFTRVRFDVLMSTGAWEPVTNRMPIKTGPGVCTKCKTENAYQPGPYLCASCSGRT